MSEKDVTGAPKDFEVWRPDPDGEWGLQATGFHPLNAEDISRGAMYFAAQINEILTEDRDVARKALRRDMRDAGLSPAEKFEKLRVFTGNNQAESEERARTLFPCPSASASEREASAVKRNKYVQTRPDMALDLSAFLVFLGAKRSIPGLKFKDVKEWFETGSEETEFDLILGFLMPEGVVEEDRGILELMKQEEEAEDVEDEALGFPAKNVPGLGDNDGPPESD